MKHRLNPWVPPNVRFWVWWNNDPVKLTLKPDQTLTLYEAHRTDEGWSSMTERYTHAGDRVECETVSEGVDCDGRLKTGWKGFARIDQLQQEPICRFLDYFDGERYRTIATPYVENGRECLRPDWTEGKSWQRDYSAEAAGY